MLPLLSFSVLLYWSNDPLILFCWLYRWSFKATVKCAIKSSRQLTVLIYKQMQLVINRRLKWSNGRASFYIKSYNLSLLSLQPSVLLYAPRHQFADKKAASVSIALHPPLLQTLNLCLKKKKSSEQCHSSFILEILLRSWPVDICRFSMWCSFAGDSLAPETASEGPKELAQLLPSRMLLHARPGMF